MHFYSGFKTHIPKKMRLKISSFFFFFFFATNFKTKQIRKSGKYTRTIFFHELLVHVPLFHNLVIFRLRTTQLATFLKHYFFKSTGYLFFNSRQIWVDIYTLEWRKKSSLIRHVISIQDEPKV